MPLIKRDGSYSCDAPAPKKVKIDPNELPYFHTVNVLGAAKGTKIRGIVPTDDIPGPPKSDLYAKVEGVILEVVSGAVLPQKEARAIARAEAAKNGEKTWEQILGTKLGIETAKAKLLIDAFENDMVITNSKDPNYNNDAGYLGGSGNLQSYDKRILHTFCYGDSDSTLEKCRFKIVEAGAWGKYKSIMEIVNRELIVSTNDLGRALNEGNKNTSDSMQTSRPGPMVLLSRNFIAISKSGIVEHIEGSIVNVRVTGTLAAKEPAVYYDLAIPLPVVAKGAEPPEPLAPLHVRVPPSGTFPVYEMKQEEQVRTLVRKAIDIMSHAWKGEREGFSKEAMYVQADVALEWINDSLMKDGALKSLMQKAIRFGSYATSMPFDDKKMVDTRIVVLACVAKLFTIKSSFQPALGLQVRGCTAALKRVGVILVEDAWISDEQKLHLNMDLMLINNPMYERPSHPPPVDIGSILSSLMCMAFLTSKMDSYHPPINVILSTMVVGAAAQRSRQIIAWRPEHGYPLAQTVSVDKTSMYMAARILRIVRSFKGDMDMFDIAASRVKTNKITKLSSLQVCQNQDNLKEGTAHVMPFKHMVDFHVWKGVLLTTVEGALTYQDRTKNIFMHLTGTNTRLGTLTVDETLRGVVIARNQQEIVMKLFFQNREAHPYDYPDMDMKSVIKTELDYGILAGGVGPISISVATTDAEKKVKKWNLIGVLGVEDQNEIFITKTTEHRPKKSSAPVIITESAKYNGRVQIHTIASTPNGLPFKSPMLKHYNRVSYDITSKAYFIHAPSSTGLDPIWWSYDTPHVIEVGYRQIDAFDTKRLHSNFSHSFVCEILDELMAMPTGKNALMTENYECSLVEVMHKVAVVSNGQRCNTGRASQLRLLSLLRNKYSEVSLPTPANNGGKSDDQLVPVEGDWIIWTALVTIARIAPGALRPKMAPNFQVVDARILRHVESVLSKEFMGKPDTNNVEKFSNMYKHVKSRYGTKRTLFRFPRPYQLALVEKMTSRDLKAIVKTHGHFISLDTGEGKTLTALLYALEYGTSHGNVDKIIWFSPNSAVQAAYNELKLWGLGENKEMKNDGTDILNEMDIGIVDPNHIKFDKFINIVNFDNLSHGNHREALEGELKRVSENAFIVVDEVHALYNNSIRTSTIRQTVTVAQKFVAMTATPSPNKSQALVASAWFADCVGFPLNDTNQLVGAAQMVAAKVVLRTPGTADVPPMPITMREETIGVDISAEAQLQHRKYLLDGQNSYAHAAKGVRLACFDVMVDTIVKNAKADRANYSNGGVLVFMDNKTEVDDIIMLINLKIINDKFLCSDHEKRYKDLTQTGQDEFGVVVATKTDVAGYNDAIRLGYIVSGVYAGNASNRHQARGRVRRQGQMREEVVFTTIYPKNTILSLLHDRHSQVDSRNTSLEALAELYISQDAKNSMKSS